MPLIRCSRRWDRTILFALLTRALAVTLTLVTAVLGSDVRAGAEPRRGAPADREPSITVQSSPARVVAGAWDPLTFTFSSTSETIANVTFTVSVPEGWATPSTSSLDAGRVVTSAGVATVLDRSIAIVGADVARGSAIVVTYGGGPSGVTTPTTPGLYTFKTTMARGPDTRVRSLGRRVVEVRTPRSHCRTNTNPGGTGLPLRLPNGIARVNLHNVDQSTGVIRQCYSATQGLTTDISLAGITPLRHGPAGYPEVAYGYDAYGLPYCRGCHSEPFPLRVADLGEPAHDFWVTTRYALNAPSPDSLPLDFIYDFWLEQNPAPGAAPQPGDVELLVFLYEQNIATCLDNPTPETFETPAIFDGRPILSSWKVCHIRGGTEATPIAFFLEHPAPSRSAGVSLRIRDFLTQAADYLQMDLRSYLLMGVELGGEFDQCEPGACRVSDSNWEFRISQLSLEAPSATIPVVFVD